jgi:hypothetical protein
LRTSGEQLADGTPRFADAGRYTPAVAPAIDEALPGADLVRTGLDDLRAGRESAEAWLVLIGAPRLRRAGIEVPHRDTGIPEHGLYELLARTDSDTAHSRYNALIRRLVSFERAVECAGR